MLGRHPFGMDKEWKDWQNCPKGTFIDGFTVRYHPLIGVSELKASCATKRGNRVQR